MFFAALGACSGVAPSSVDAATRPEPQIVTKIIPSRADADVLFVIDDSSLMQGEQTLFASNISSFVEGLDASPTGRPNLHIGIVSSSVDIGTAAFGASCQLASENGLLQHAVKAGSCTPPSNSYLIDVASGSARTTNFTGTLDAELACLLPLGTDGCGLEAQLEAVKRALDGTHLENAGFLRPGALLDLIFLTDADDCSAANPSLFTEPASQVGAGDFRCAVAAYTCDHPIDLTMGGTYQGCTVKTGSYLSDPSTYYDFLEGLKPGQVLVSMIAGDPRPDVLMTGAASGQSLSLLPSCTVTIDGNQDTARPGIRLFDFTQRFTKGSSFETICQPDYSNALIENAMLLRDALGPCLDGAIASDDTDPANPGVQPACLVTDELDFDSPQEISVAIPACPMSGASTPSPSGPRPCWWIGTDPAMCTAQPHFALHVERSQPPPVGDEVEVQCIGTI